MSGWGNLLGKIADQFAGRIERLKNEKNKLEDERELLTRQDWTSKSGRRVNDIDHRLLAIDKILANKASD